jgi:hypothetical protein
MNIIHITDSQTARSLRYVKVVICVSDPREIKESWLYTNTNTRKYREIASERGLQLIKTHGYKDS